MQIRTHKCIGAGLAALSGLAMAGQATMASAQPDYSQGEVAPPAGSYAEPPPGYNDDGSATYDDRSQDYDRDYASRYSAWAATNCVNRRNNNAAAGAIIGGVLGAVVGSNVSGRGNRTAGGIVGGAVGATAGASIGANSGSGAYCPPGYVVRAGAPAFAYSGPYGGSYYAGPGWYNPWVFTSGRYVYRPYRYWYWNNRHYGRRGGRARPWHARHRRW
jgi:hypothetical protein